MQVQVLVLGSMLCCASLYRHGQVLCPACHECSTLLYFCLYSGTARLS